jgi:hypothetical protein
LDATVQGEIADLHRQLAQTASNYAVAWATAAQCQKERQISELTRAELDKQPDSSPSTTGLSKGGDSSRVYRGMGKVFVLSMHDDVASYLEGIIRGGHKRASLSTAGAMGKWSGTSGCCICDSLLLTRSVNFV